MRIKQGEIWFIDLDPARRGEMGKIRPCLVVSDDQYNDAAGAPLIMPITSYSPTIRSPLVAASAQTGLSADSSVLPLHIRPVSRSRFVRRLGRAPVALVEQVVNILSMVIQPRRN